MTNPAITRMIVCAECGNKRCPKATYHDNKCTNSNATNQPGDIGEIPAPRTLSFTASNEQNQGII
jgi:hypothetical protein